MTPLQNLLALAKAATTGSEENDKYVMDGLSVSPPAYMDDEDRAWRDFVAALLPSTIQSLVEKAMRAEALDAALDQEYFAHHDQAATIHARAEQILANREKGT